LISLIMKKGKKQADLTDASFCAQILYQRFEANLFDALRLSNHGKDLIALGLGEDLSFSAQTDITALVPTFKEGVVKR
jgi:phosphosulfolactate phosphohydrolase-like enzyme